jgi:Ca-activated chloride channel family protein
MHKTVIYIAILLVFSSFFKEGIAQTQSYTKKTENTTIAPPPPFKKQLTRILFIFDFSNSMYGMWDKESKVTTARRIFIELIDSLEKVPNIEMALRLYGHQSTFPPQDCNDTKLEVPFSPGNAGAIRQKIRWAEPKGTTPIAKSLEQCVKDFPNDGKDARNIIMLITDGIESCDGDPCAVSAMLQQKGIMLKPFVIGVGLNVDLAKAFGCVGRFFNAKEGKQFQKVLNIAMAQAINSTTAQVNILDVNKKPVETDVTMTFYDQVSGLMKYNYVHTINSKGVPDTIQLDPLMSYRMVIQTIPPVVKENIELASGKHNTIVVSAPQGSLILKRPGATNNASLQFLVKDQNDQKILNVQTADRNEKYLIGKYDVEILTLPRILIKDVVITQSQTTTLQVAQTGMVVLTKSGPGYGGIYVQNKNKWDLVVNLDFASNQRETYNLQPGNYFVTFRPTLAKDVRYSVDKKFTIKSGSIEQIKLN